MYYGIPMLLVIILPSTYKVVLCEYRTPFNIPIK